MNNDQYFTCNFFKQSKFKIKKNFIVSQEEILQEEGNQFKKHKVQYECEWEKKSFNKNFPTLIVPIKNNLDLLKYTLCNFKNSGLLKKN